MFLFLLRSRLGVRFMQTKGHMVGLSAVAAVAAIVLLGFDASAQDAKKTPRAPSACKGLDEKACKGKAADCRWIVPSKGKQKPYCRLGAAKKKAK
jgi:hypothetical protein